MQEKEHSQEKSLDESISKAQKLKELIDKETNELERKYQMLKNLNKQVDSNNMDFDTNLENKFTEIRTNKDETPQYIPKQPVVIEFKPSVEEDEEVNPYAKYYMNPARSCKPRYSKTSSKNHKL